MNRELLPDGSAKPSIYQVTNVVDTLWWIGLAIAAVFLFGVNLGGLPLRDWDEGTVAQVARELWQSPPGSWRWLYPTLAEQAYWNKPPLIHLLIAGVYKIGGVNEWTTRLPGALLSALSVPLLYSLGRELFSRRLPALFAALMYLTLLPVVRHGRLAMLDGAVICFSLMMMLCLLRARRDLRWALGVGLEFGLICLTKSMMGVLLGAIAFMFLIWDTPRLLTSRYLWGGVLLGSAPVALWYGAQWLHYGDPFIQGAILNQSIDRIWKPVEGNTGSPWYYLWEISKTACPWLLFLPTGLWYAWQHRNLSWAKFTLIWSGGYFLVVSAMQTKLPWYILPIYPPLSLIGGMQLARLWRWLQLTATSSQPAPLQLRVLMGGLGVLAVASWGSSLYYGWLALQPAPDLQLVLGAFAFTLTIAIILMSQRNPQALTVLIWGTYFSLSLFMVSNHWIWELAETYPVKPVAAIVQRSTPVGAIVFTSYPEGRPSLNFYSDRQVVPTTDDSLRQHWQQTNPRPYLLLDQASLQRLNLAAPKELGTAEGWHLVTPSQQ